MYARLPHWHAGYNQADADIRVSCACTCWLRTAVARMYPGAMADTQEAFEDGRRDP